MIASICLRTRFFKLSMLSLGHHIVVTITDVHISQEIFALDKLTPLTPSSERDRAHVLQLLRLHGDQA